MNLTREVVVVGAARTAIGRFDGTLSQTPATELGGVAIRAALERSGIDPATVDEVLMGHVLQAGVGQAPARQAAINAGLPDSVGASTINKVCGSSLKTITLGAAMIRAGDADVIVAGGMENMNLGPYLLKQARTGYRLGNAELIDATVQDGLWCTFEDWHMGSAAEFIATKFDVSREEQDAFALESHRRAIRAIDECRFQAEIAPVIVPVRKGEPLVFDTDEAPRRDTSAEALARLRPLFDANGTVTAGNAPSLNDGAAAVVIMDRAAAETQGIQPLARIRAYAQAAVPPKWIFRAPVVAIRILMENEGTDIADYDLIEVNEAFAAQVVANGKELEWDWDRLNVNGGAIALGHPIGASGARIVVTLLHAMQQRGVRTGLAAACLGGGEAVALGVELL
ncbi:MAG: acetyl-CoA C-acetyltransferase [Anaerolineae bacterium]